MTTVFDELIWARKYEPKTIDDYVGNEEFIAKVKYWIETNSVPNLILYSEKSGTGKCLDFSEEVTIEIELTESELKLLSAFIV
jgi:replication-associated recombination protein RarA